MINTSSSYASRVVAPAAALAYPALVWSGVRVSAVVLATTLIVPSLALAAAYQLGRDHGFPVARRIAHLAIAAPPLFTLLGGWLDFQHVIPIGSLGVWIPLWTLLIIAALAERPRGEPGPLPRGRRLAMAHGASAAVIAVFALAHLVNHLGGLFGGDAHMAIMRALRTIYRNRIVEPILLVAVVFQVATGCWLLLRKLRRPGGGSDTLQTATGAYLMIFLLSHISAVARARMLHNVDTNWAWLSGGELLTDPWSARLVPYYFVAVIAFGVHAGCGLRTALLGHGVAAARGSAIVAVLAGLATLVSTLILIGLLRA